MMMLTQVKTKNVEVFFNFLQDRVYKHHCLSVQTELAMKYNVEVGY